jgi:uncharacterized membrane protein
MSSHAAITVNRPRDEVQRLWSNSAYRPRYFDEAHAAVVFKDAPGDRGTEIHVDLAARAKGGKLGELVQELFGGVALPKVKEDLRRFKRYVETGEIPRSDATPAGELAERMLKQRPAQPLKESELEQAGVR